MKIKPITQIKRLAKFYVGRFSNRSRQRSILGGRVALLGCLGLLSAAGSAVAQFSVSLTANPIRITIPVSGTGSYTNTVTVTVNNADAVSHVTLAPQGVPAGATVSFDQTDFTNSGTATMILNYANVAEGSYDFAVAATGDAAYRLPIPVQVGYQWNSLASAGNLTAAANWIGGVAPGASDTIVIPDVTFGDNSTPSILVTGDTEVGAVRDIHNGNSTFPNLNIAAGATLSVTGDGGYQQLRDTLTSNSRAYIQGSGEGTLLVSNANAGFNLFVYAENTQNRFYFDQLNTLKLDVNWIAIDDIIAYPNYLTNGTSTYPRRFSPLVLFAKTNIFRATMTDANDWTNSARNYSFVIDRHRSGNGSGQRFGMRLGLDNEFYCNSMLWGGSGSSCDSGNTSQQINFNTAFSGTPNLIIRGPNGGRMSNWTLGDAGVADGGTVSQGTKIRAYLGGGMVDALVDSLYLGRTADLTSGGQGTGYIDYDTGVIDVNNAYLGYQTGPGLGAGNYAQGTLNVNGTAIFRANNSIVLGYTESAETTTGVNSGYGQINIAGGTVEANAITVGGPTALSVDNNITLSSGGTLIITNTAGTISAPLNVLSMSDSTLTLHVDGAKSDPYVFATTLTTGGAGNTIRLASVTGFSSYPSTIPLISYSGSAAPNFTLELPSGLYGYVVNNTGAHTIDAVITTTAPQSLVWNGSPGATWDTSSANWQGGKVFNNGDQVTFDDTAAGSTSVAVSGTVIPGPGGALVNTTNSYSFTGGTIDGTAVMTKNGSGSLTIDSDCKVALVVNAGSVDGTVGLGATTVAAGASLNYSGSINGLTTSGNSINSGTVNIGLSVMDGAFINSGTINGTFNLSGGVTTNTAGSTIEASGSSSSVGAGATLDQEGQFNNNVGRLSIAGVLTGSGTVSDLTGDVNGNNGRLEINAGAIFTPGGSNQIGTFTVEGRFDLNAGSPDGKMIVDVDMNNPKTNDVLYVDKWSNFRGALEMNNIGSVPFAAGQSFTIFKQNFGQPNTPETAFDLQNKITPAAPGVGLQWDLSNLRTNGIIAVVAAPTTPPAITTSVANGTLTVSWPADHIGYQLQVQTNSLSTGLSNNWYSVSGSEDVTSWDIPIDSNAPAVFYRLSNQ